MIPSFENMSLWKCQRRLDPALFSVAWNICSPNSVFIFYFVFLWLAETLFLLYGPRPHRPRNTTKTPKCSTKQTSWPCVKWNMNWGKLTWRPGFQLIAHLLHMSMTAVTGPLTLSVLICYTGIITPAWLTGLGWGALRQHMWQQSMRHVICQRGGERRNKQWDLSNKGNFHL